MTIRTLHYRTKLCRQCGGAYTPSHSSHYYCSPACKHNALKAAWRKANRKRRAKRTDGNAKD